MKKQEKQVATLSAPKGFDRVRLVVESYDDSPIEVSSGGATFSIKSGEESDVFFLFGDRTIKVSGCLFTITCHDNLLTEVDVSDCFMLEELDCEDNNLTRLNVAGCSMLEALYCGGNQLTELDVSDCSKLAKLDYAGNQLSEVDVSRCALLKSKKISKKLKKSEKK